MRAWAVSCGWRSLCMDFLPPSGSLLQGYRRVSRADGHVIFKVRWWLVESISQWSRNFQEAFLLLLTFKNGSNNSGLMWYWMKQRWFFRNEFFSKKLLIQHLLRYAVGAILYWISGFGEAQQSFLKSDLKNLIQNLWVGTNSPCLLRLQTRKFLCRKITVRFKLNLKTDGLDCKMIFKFWKNVEMFHSTRKQGRRIYNVCICKQCVCLYKHHLRCKTLVGEHPNPWTASGGCRLF